MNRNVSKIDHVYLNVIHNGLSCLYKLNVTRQSKFYEAIIISKPRLTRTQIPLRKPLVALQASLNISGSNYCFCS